MSNPFFFQKINFCPTFISLPLSPHVTLSLTFSGRATAIGAKFCALTNPIRQTQQATACQIIAMLLFVFNFCTLYTFTFRREHVPILKKTKRKQLLAVIYIPPHLRARPASRSAGGHSVDIVLYCHSWDSCSCGALASGFMQCTKKKSILHLVCNIICVLCC